MEIWKDIIGYEGLYQVSNFGRVKILERIFFVRGKYPIKKNENILKLHLNTHGYYRVSLIKNKTPKTITVHKLVAIAFLNHKPCGLKLVVNHINFVRTDNRVENLEIVTQRENANQKHLKSSSKYTGVSWNKNQNKWVSKIKTKNKQKHLGTFENEYDAHLAYQSELKRINSFQIKPSKN